MRKLLNKPWFVAVAAVVALLMVGNSVRSAMGGPAREVAAALPEAAPADPSAEAADAELPPVLPVAEALQALVIPVKARDPFAARPRPEVVAEPPAEPDLVDRLHLSAIWTQANATLVLINERICAPGDEIGRLKIESATQEGVWVTHWKGRDFLALGADFVLHTPARAARAATTETKTL
jgi:hypothetical protein